MGKCVIKNEMATFLFRNIPKDLWIKFKEICNRDNEWPNDRLLRMIEEEVEREESK